MLLPTEYITRFVQRAAIHRMHRMQQQTGQSHFSSYTGEHIARSILSYKGIKDVHISCTDRISDSFHPIHRKIYLSPTVYHESHVRAVAVAAHEAGHATQAKWLNHLNWFRVRLEWISDIAVIASLFFLPTLLWQSTETSQLPFLVRVCLLLLLFVLFKRSENVAKKKGNETGQFLFQVMEIGCLFVPLLSFVNMLHWEWFFFLWLLHFSCETLVCSFFLFVEADASIRAYTYMKKLNLIRHKRDRQLIREVLSLAFLTYVSEFLLAFVCFWLIYR